MHKKIERFIKCTKKIERFIKCTKKIERFTKCTKKLARFTKCQKKIETRQQPPLMLSDQELSGPMRHLQRDERGLSIKHDRAWFKDETFGFVLVGHPVRENMRNDETDQAK